MFKRFCPAPSCFIQHQRYFTATTKPKSTLIARLKKRRPDLRAIAEPRHALQWAQKVIQSRWKVWIHASKARFLSTSLFDLDAKQFSDLAKEFVNCGSKGELSSCQSSTLLANGAYMLPHKELVETIDRRLLAAFYDYSLPNLKSSLQQLKALCQFSPTAWFPHSRSLTRSIYVHKYNANSRSQDTLLEMINRTAAPSTTIFCGNNTLSLSSSIHATCTHLDYLAYTLQHATSIVNELILGMDGTLQQQNWRWTKAFLDTQANTIHILMPMDNHSNYTGWIKRLEQTVKDRGEHLAVVDHRMIKAGIGVSGDDNKWNFTTQLGALQSLQDIRPGDCIVVKSRRMMMNMKDRLEHDYGLKCLLLFPQLPEAIQLQQINAFNNTDSVPKVLLMAEGATTPNKIHASRLLFKTIKKKQQDQITYDSLHRLKQIVNQVGPTQAIMLFDKTDIPFIRQALKAEDPLPIQETLCVLPSKNIFETFYNAMPQEMAMSTKMEAFEVLSDVSDGYILDNWTHQKVIADWLEHYPLAFDDRWTFMNAPLDILLTKSKTTIQLFGEAVSRGTPCELADALESSLNSTIDVIKLEPLMTLLNQYHIIQWYHLFRSKYPTIFVTDETVLQKHLHQYQTIILETLDSNCSHLADRRRKNRQHHKMGQLVERLLGQTSTMPNCKNNQGTK